MLWALLKELLKYVPSQVLPGLIGFISIPVITRWFSPEDYGNYTLVLATVTVLAGFSGWVGMGVIRFYAPYREAGKEREFKAGVVLLCLGTVAAVALVSCLFLVALRRALPTALGALLAVGVLVFLGRSISDTLSQFLRVQHRLGWFGFYKSWEAGGAVLLGFALVLALGTGIEGLLWGAAAASFLTLPFLWRQVLGRISPSLDGTARRRLTREMAAYSFPLVVGNLAAWVLSLGDRYVLALFRSSYEVGVYAAGYNIAERTILMLSTLFMFASGPLVVEVWETKGARATQELMSNVVRAYVVLCLPAVVGLAALSRPAMEVLTGAQYQAGYRVLPWVAAGAFFVGLQQRYQTGLILGKRTVPIMASMLGAGGLNVALNLIFVPRYGYLAAAVTTLVCYVLLTAFMIVASRRELTWRFPFATLARSAIASALMAAVVYPIGQGLTASPLVNLVAGVASGVAVYTLALVAAGELRQGEKEKLRQVLHRGVGFVGQQGRAR